MTTRTTAFRIPMMLIAAVIAGVAIVQMGNQELGPSYEEIYQDMVRITQRDLNLGGPEVGLDGLVDPDIRKAWESYSKSMLGKRVEGWRGWYAEYVHHPTGKHNVIIHMEKTLSEQRTWKRVIIRNVTPTKLEEVKTWTVGQVIEFEGRIDWLSWDGQVHLTDGVMRPVDESLGQ